MTGAAIDTSSKAGKLRKAIYDLLLEHESAGEDALPTNARFLFYELVTRGAVEKHKPREATGRRSDQDLHEALTWLREKLLVPWEWIEDETRALNDYTGYASIKAGAIGSLRFIRLDPWRGRAPMILSESRSVAGAARNLAQQYATKLSATNGQVGGFLHTDIAPQLKPGDRVLYIGDFDWQGGQIEGNTRAVLERKIGGPLDWERIALTEQQVDGYDLRRLQIDKPDRRYKPTRYHPAVETEALKQEVIVRIIREQLDAELPEPLTAVLGREAGQQRYLADLLADV